MKLSKENYLKLIRAAFSLIVITAMFYASSKLNESEIIFPEVAALLLGGWINKKEPWTISKPRMCVLMSVGSLAGMLLARSSMPFAVKVLLGFIFIAFFLISTRTTLYPVISSCILPIFLHTTSFVYPIVVTTLVLIVALGQKLFEATGLREKEIFTPVQLRNPQLIKMWILRTAVFFIVAAAPFIFNKILFVAPPLIVTYAEFTNPNFALHKYWFRTLIVIFSASILGALGRYFFCINFNVPAFIIIFFSAIILLILMHFLKLYFPPAGAVLMLPYLLQTNALLPYPVQILIGASILIFAAKIVAWIIKEKILSTK